MPARVLLRAVALGFVVLLAWPPELEARGRGRGGISRGGAARGGSIRHGGVGRGHRSYDRGRTGGWQGRQVPTREPGWGNRDWGAARPRPEEAPGAGEARRPEGREEARARREERRNDPDRKVKIKKTDDGFVAVGAKRTEDGGRVGVVRRENGQTRIRAVERDGDEVSWGGANCRRGRCVGGAKTVRIEDYDYDPYYYYPYYYGWYSCPYGATTWSGPYGNPVYGCANVVVVSTTISMGVDDSAPASSMAAGDYWPAEARVSSAPVVMYAVRDDAVAYATSYEPEGVYARRFGDRYVWAPGPARESPEAKAVVDAAGAMDAPTANSTVITYAEDGRVVYLTNERPLPGFYAEEADYLFAWIPGVREPDEADRQRIRRVLEAHRSGGRKALDREVRKLEVDREPPPEAPG